MDTFGEEDARKEAECFSWLRARAECLQVHSGPGMHWGFPGACWASQPAWLSLPRAILLMSCLPSVLLYCNILQLISQ